MGQLHEQSPAAPEQQNRFAAHPSNHCVVGEKPRHRVQGTFCGHARAGTTKAMGSLVVLFVPLCLILLSVLLFATAWLEENVLSPRSLILHTVRTRSRHVHPEQVERLVAAQSERLLRNLAR